VALTFRRAALIGSRSYLPAFSAPLQPLPSTVGTHINVGGCSTKPQTLQAHVLASFGAFCQSQCRVRPSDIRVPFPVALAS
jgi:hypothetical protein